MPSVADLPAEAIAQALELLGAEVPEARTRAVLGRAARERLAEPGAVAALLGTAPEGAREAFVTLASRGGTTVEDLLGRGWWGRGALPEPLDWLQVRALVLVQDGLVHATDEAVAGFREPALPLEVPEDLEVVEGPEAVRVEATATVVVAPSAAALDLAVAVPAAGLRTVAPTVAVSDRRAQAVTAALRAAGVVLDDDQVVAAAPEAPALPLTTEEAVGPRAVRALLTRALAEGRQVRLQYFASSRGGAATERVVDPWSFADDLLRGWCHLRTDERAFAVDRIGRARLLPAAIDHPAPSG